MLEINSKKDLIKVTSKSNYRGNLLQISKKSPNQNYQSKRAQSHYLQFEWALLLFCIYKDEGTAYPLKPLPPKGSRFLFEVRDFSKL